MSYADVYRRSIDDPEGFWMQEAQAIDWDVAPTRALFSDRAPLSLIHISEPTRPY